MMNVGSNLERIAPGLVKVLDERDDLIRGLYRLALRSHTPGGEPCDEDIECQDCTLLLIASEELDEDDPWPPRRSQA